jgi:hypothetical protein
MPATAETQTFAAILSTMKLKILISIFTIFTIKVQSQNLFVEKFDDCHQAKFTFCLDCGEPKANYEGDLDEYFNSKLKGLSKNLNGKIFVQLIIDSLGKQCVKSIQNDLNVKNRVPSLKHEINTMPHWKPALENGKPKSSSRVLIFSFNKGEVSTSIKDFDFKNTQNMKSVGVVEIKDPGKFKNNLDEKLFHVYNTQNSSVPWDMSRSISIDKNKTIWYGTDNGIVKIISTQFEILNHKNSALKQTKYNANKTASIMASCIDSNNNKWFSDGYTVYKYDENTWQAFDSLNSPIKWTTGIYADSFGNVYFEGFHGMNKYNGKEWTTLTIQNSNLPSNRVMGVFVDSKKRLWVGTDKGNIRIDGSTIEYFKNSENPLRTSTLTKGYEDKDGNIWFSLYEKFPQTKGFAKYSKDEIWTIVNTENSAIPKNDVLDFAIDEIRNVIWLSINKVGLCRFDGKEWATLTPENSKVPSTYIQNISLDDRGNLWCATFSGLLRIDYPE